MFWATNETPCSERLNKHYHLISELKLSHGKYAIVRIPFACVACTNILDNPWVLGVDYSQQPHYQPVVVFTYWLVLGSFNDWNIIQFTNKTTSSEEFYDAHKVVLDYISSNIV